MNKYVLMSTYTETKNTQPEKKFYNFLEAEISDPNAPDGRGWDLTRTNKISYTTASSAGYNYTTSDKEPQVHTQDYSMKRKGNSFFYHSSDLAKPYSNNKLFGNYVTNGTVKSYIYTNPLGNTRPLYIRDPGVLDPERLANLDTYTKAEISNREWMITNASRREASRSYVYATNVN
jgi:hypothetical protein